MQSETINGYLNDYVSGNENDHEIECTQSEYGVIRIIVKAKIVPCSCCKTEKKRVELTSKRWTDGKGLPRSARMCQECSAIAQDLYGI